MPNRLQQPAIPAATCALLAATLTLCTPHHALAQDDADARERVRLMRAIEAQRNAAVLNARRAAQRNPASITGPTDPDAADRASALVAELATTDLAKTARDRAARRLIALLDDPAFSVRNAAEHELRTSTLHADTILDIIDADTPPQAREHLLQAAYRRFFEAPRAAVGISMNSPIRGTPPTVMSLTPGFPAADTGALLLGDHVITLAGIDTSDPSFSYLDLRAAIQSHNPGQTARTTIERPVQPDGADEPKPLAAPTFRAIQDGRLDPPWWLDPQTPRTRLTIDLPLGSFARLNNGPSDATTLANAWRIRLQREDIPRSAAQLRPTIDQIPGPGGLPLAGTQHADTLRFTPATKSAEINEQTQARRLASARNARFRNNAATNSDNADSQQLQTTGQLRITHRTDGRVSSRTVEPALDPAPALASLARAADTLRRLAARAAAPLTSGTAPQSPSNPDSDPAARESLDHACAIAKDALDHAEDTSD